MHVFSYCPAIWKALESDWQVRDLGEEPMAAFDHLAAARAQGRPGETLIVFSSFLRRNALRTMLPYASWHDVLDVAVGSGDITMRLRGEQRELYWSGLEVERPCLSRALQRIGDQVLGHKASAIPACGIQLPRNPDRTGIFRILLSPFTSKRSPLTAYDWAEFTAALARALPAQRRVSCVVLPGMTPECNAHAADIARLVSHHLRDRGTASVAQVDGYLLRGENAIEYVARELAQTELLFGIDTYTAHLAAETGTVSIALCLDHNERFWAPSPWTFWFNLQAGRHTVLQAGRAVTRLLGGGKQAGLPFTGALHATTLLSGAGGMQAANARDLVDRVWNALPGSVRDALERLDGELSWPCRRDRFDRSADRALLLRSNFFRLLGIVEPALWSNDDLRTA
jgi:hypothetical protein